MTEVDHGWCRSIYTTDPNGILVESAPSPRPRRRRPGRGGAAAGRPKPPLEAPPSCNGPSRSPSAPEPRFTTRPFLGYWPDPADEPVRRRRPGTHRAGALRRGRVLRGISGWPPPAGTSWPHHGGTQPPTGRLLRPLRLARSWPPPVTHARVRHAFVNNDVDCLHEKGVVDVGTAMVELRRHGVEAVVLLGNCGGGSLMAWRWPPSPGLGDAFVALAAHPGEGVFMLQVIDPSVTRSGRDPFHGGSRDSTCTTPTTAGGRGRNRRPTTRAGLPRTAPRSRPERVRARRQHRPRRARRSRRARCESGAKRGAGRTTGIHQRRRAIHARYITTYRTLADPAYLDLSIDPDNHAWDRLRVPDPLDANYGLGGLETGHDRSRLVVDVVPVYPHPTRQWPRPCPRSRYRRSSSCIPPGDTEIRLHHARAIYEASGAEDKQYVEIAGAVHYLTGRRQGSTGQRHRLVA